MWSRPADLLRWLDGRKLDAVIHLGAISDTTATDGDLVMENNFRLSLRLLDWCTATRTPFIYASSAATYGDGADGLRRRLVARGAAAAQADQSLRLEQASVRPGRGRARRAEGEAAAAMGGAEVLQRVRAERVPQGRDDEPRRQALRRRQGRRSRCGCSSRIAPASRDGDQRRDFIYVDDAVAVVRWLLETPQVSGIFNVGTGKARSFRDLIAAMFRALGRAPNIEYVDMPDDIRGQYQYFTQAEVENLRRAGYNAGFTPLEDGVSRYVTAVPRSPPTATADRCNVRFRKTLSEHRASRPSSASAT